MFVSVAAKLYEASFFVHTSFMYDFAEIAFPSSIGFSAE